jgi:malonyl CoA-acyl carrier protein transacylase
MADGSYPFSDGLKLIDTRGEEMRKASIVRPGTMLVASGLPFKDAKKIAKEFPGVYAVNDNPGVQTVFAGRADALQAIGDYLTTTKEGEVRLHWPGIPEAAHSIHMEPAIDGLKRALKEVKIKPPSHDFIGNQARRLGSTRAVRQHLWRQLTRGVLLTATANKLYNEYEIRTFVDVGPGKVLYGQLKRHFRRSVELVSLVDELLPEK